MTQQQVTRLVNNWIGVSPDGYLGNFSYAKHDVFWAEVADMAVDTHAFPGSTRRCFEATLLGAPPRAQAAVIRRIIQDYPRPEVADPDRPRFRHPDFEAELRALAISLESGADLVIASVEQPPEVVRRALADAEALIGSQGAQSAVDRLHTAMHGYLLELCREAGVSGLPERPTMNQLFKRARNEHPALSDFGHRGSDIERMLGSMATILDALNPVRNQGSVAHPNHELVGEAEAVLVINTVRTMLSYLEGRRSAHG